MTGMKTAGDFVVPVVVAMVVGTVAAGSPVEQIWQMARSEALVNWLDFVLLTSRTVRQGPTVLKMDFPGR